MKSEIIKGNHKATITEIVDGYGDKAFRVIVTCISGTHDGGDVIYLKNHDKASTAQRAAQRELDKSSN